MTTKRRNVALVIEGMGSSAASSAGIAWHYGKASIGTPGNYEWKGGTGSREGLIRPPDSVGCSVDRFECQLQGNAHTFELHASGLAKALFLGRPTRPRDVLSTAIDEDDTTVAFNGDFYAWSSSDDGTVVWIGDEAIKLGTYGAGPQFTGCTRGFWSTNACGQPAGMNVYAQNPKIINRRAQLMVYDRDAGTTTQAWQGFVQSLAIDNGVISVSCQDVWSRIVGAKVNRKAIDHSSSLGRGVSSGGQVVQDEQIIRAGGIKLPSTYTSGVHKLSATSPKWHSFQAVGALFHAYDLAGTQAFWRDRTSGASGDSAAQLGSFIDPDQVSRGGGIKNAPVYEVFAVDRIRDSSDGNSADDTIRSSTRYLDNPYHPVAVSMALLTSSWSPVEGVVLPDPIVMFSASSAKWQDTAKTTPADAHGDPIRRIDNEGTLGGYWSGTAAPPALNKDLAAAEAIETSGASSSSASRMTLAGSTDTTPVSGTGFEVFIAFRSFDTRTNRGPLAKYSSPSSQIWLMISAATTAPYGEQAGPSGYTAKNTSSGSVLGDGKVHVFGWRVDASDDVYVSVDGVDVAGPVAATLPAASAQDLVLGAYDLSNIANTSLAMNAHALRIYDQALSAEQRAAVITAMTPASDVPPVYTVTESIHDDLAAETGTVLCLSAASGSLADLAGNLTGWTTTPSTAELITGQGTWIDGTGIASTADPEFQVTSSITIRIKLRVGDSTPDANDVVVTCGANGETLATNTLWQIGFTDADTIYFFHEAGAGVNHIAYFDIPNAMVNGQIMYIVARRTDNGDGTCDVEMWMQQDAGGTFAQLTLDTTSGTDNGDDTATLTNPAGGTSAKLGLFNFPGLSQEWADGMAEVLHVKAATTTDAAENAIAALLMPTS